MAQSERKADRPADGPGKRVTNAARTVQHALPADPDRAVRHLDDGQLDRLRDAVVAETRRRGRPAGRDAR